MFCKNCGKELPMDDSKYCPNCGANQNSSASNFISHVKSFYQIHKKITILYVVWLLIHLSLYTNASHVIRTSRNYIGGFSYVYPNPQEKFYPFDSYNIDDYDLSELLFYVITIPFIAYLIIKFLKIIKHLLNKRFKK